MGLFPGDPYACELIAGTAFKDKLLVTVITPMKAAGFEKGSRAGDDHHSHRDI